MKSGLEIKRLPIGSTIQDRGRNGYRRFGVTRGGAMDIFALAEGQALLNNSEDDAALEMTGSGGKFLSIGQNKIACSGAEMKLLLNDRQVGWRQTIILNDGDLIEIGSGSEGSYSYLHLPGGIDSPVILGSRSAHAQANLGSTPEVGDHLIPLQTEWSDSVMRLLKPNYYQDHKIRILYGPQSMLFDQRDLLSLEEAEFRVTNSRNRVGIRVESSMGPINANLGTTIASDAIVAGDIQVAADGVPTILMSDFQPVGGYPRIATVITTDLHKLAQMKVGTVFRMEVTTRESALRYLKEFKSMLVALPSQVKPVIRNPKDVPDLLAYSLIDGVISGVECDAN